MSLIQKLHELQAREGFLSKESLRQLATAENTPLYRIQELVSFYPHFRTKPPANIEISVCRDMSCWLAGAESSSATIHAMAENQDDVQVHQVSCIGRCELAPAAWWNEIPVRCDDLIANDLTPVDSPLPNFSPKRWKCDPYSSPGKCYGLSRELPAGDNDVHVKRILSALHASGLRGMGGAGFPTAKKWEMVRQQSRSPKYVICNADESEPGTFKDRVILEKLSHLVVEGMILAGLVTGAQRGILYIRHEYKMECMAFASALMDARDHGLLTENDFDIDVFVSPGGYILGEETALLEALEDKRGEPRNKPPYPGTHGLFGQPTLINNVETFAFVPAIVKNGVDWWKDQGKGDHCGLKFMALSGDIEKPGVYEAPMGTTVRELIEMGGGMKGGRTLKAFAPGGASSNFLPAEKIDVPLDFAALNDAGSMLGSGALFVVGEGTDMRALATNVVQFFRNESCGKCVPCRLGTQFAVEMLDGVADGTRDRQALQMLPELGETLLQTSICGLGHVALNPILSVMNYWPDEV